MSEKVLTVTDALTVLHKASKEIYLEYPGTDENQLTLAEAILTEGISCFLADILEPTEPDAMLVQDCVRKVMVILNDLKREIIKKKRTSTNWSN